MTLMIDLPPEVQRQLEQDAARNGQEPADYARKLIEDGLAAFTRAYQIERNQAAIELLDQWFNEPPDLDEEVGYPGEITPLSLREVQLG